MACIDLQHVCDASCPTVPDLEKVAQGRMEVHRNQRTSNPIRQDREFLGISGEHAFHRSTGCALDMTVKREGDGGHDFTVHSKTIDVKCVSSPYKLLVGTRERLCDIRIMAHFIRLGGSELIGWEFDDVIHSYPTQPGLNNYINHEVIVPKLRPMVELWQFFGVDEVRKMSKLSIALKKFSGN